MPSGSVYMRVTGRLKLAAFLVAITLLGGRLTGQGGFAERDRLAVIYETILQARFDRARTLIAETCPPAPVEACLALEATALWWRIQLDPGNRSFDNAIETASARAIEAATRWTVRDSKRAEAWFYLAGAHAPLVQWRILRGQRLAAARDGKRIKDALDRAVALDPGMNDAYFGIGLYHYYADVAPAALRALRWLLFLPGGNRELGLQEMLRARDRGTFLKGEADYQLHLLYLWYERQPERALELLAGLDTRYPTNPLFLERIAEVQRDYRHDHAASLAAWQTLLDRAMSVRVELAPMTEVRARIGSAQQFIALSQPDRALDALASVAAARPQAPFGADALVQLTIGLAHERLGDATRATTALDAAIARAPSDDPENIRSRSRAALSRIRARRAR